MEVCKGPLRRRPAAGGIAHATQRMLSCQIEPGHAGIAGRVGETTGLDGKLEGTTTGWKWTEDGVDLVRSTNIPTSLAHQTVR
jgi:hypothetical protein